MGTFRVSIEGGDPLGQGYEAVEALVGRAELTLVVFGEPGLSRFSEHTPLRGCGSRPIQWGAG